jgi:hypothetical protein
MFKSRNIERIKFTIYGSLVSMNTQQKQQKTLIGLFKPITINEHQSVIEHEVEILEKVAQEKNIKCIVQKCLIGRLKKFKMTLQANQEIKQKSNEEQIRNISHVHKHGTYVN